MKIRQQILLLVCVLCSCTPTACTDSSKEKYTPGGGGSDSGKPDTETIVWHQRAYDTYLVMEKLYGMGFEAIVKAAMQACTDRANEIATELP